jgi:hypothetical protein
LRTPQARRLLTIEEAAQLVEVSTRTIIRWKIESYALPGSRRAYYLDTDVWEAERENKAAPSSP